MSEEPETTEMAPSINKPDKPKKRRGCLRKFFYVFLILVAVLLAIRFVAGYVMQSRFDAKIAELRAAGEPVELSELVPPDIPDQENAAVVYQEVFELIGLLSEEMRDKFDRLDDEREAWTPEELEEARSLVKEMAEAIRLLHKGGEREKCIYPIDYSVPGMTVLLPHLTKVQDVGRLLKISSRVNLADGKADAAVADAVQILKLGQSSYAEAILISRLVGIAVCESGLQQLEVVTNDSQPSPNALKKVIAVLGDVEDRAGYILAMRGERCIGLNCFDMILNDPDRLEGLGTSPSDERGRSAQPIRLRLAWIFRALFLMDAMTFLDVMETHVEAAEGTFAQRQGGNKLVAAKMEEMKSRSFYTHMISGFLLPAVYIVHEAFDADVAAKSVAKCAVGLRLYRMKNGRYPVKLADIAPEFIDKVPEDPFSGKPFIYRTEDKGFIIYSVGENRVDDGGAKLERRKWKEGDIVWKCSQ